MDTNRVAPKAQLLALSALTQISAAAAQFSDSPLGEGGGPIVPGNILNSTVVPFVNFLAPGIDISTWTGVFLFLGVYSVLASSTYSAVRTAFMFIDNRVTDRTDLSDSAFDNEKAALVLSLALAYVSTYSIGVISAFTISGITGLGILVVLFFAGIGFVALVIYREWNNNRPGGGPVGIPGAATPDGGYISEDGQISAALKEATERIDSAANDGSPESILQKEKRSLNKIEDVEEHLSEVLDNEKNRVSDLLDELEGAIEKGESELELLKEVNKNLRDIRGVLRKPDAGSRDENWVENIQDNCVSIGKKVDKIADMEQSEYLDVNHVVKETENTISDLQELFRDIQKIRKDLRKTSSINAELESENLQITSRLRDEEHEEEKAEKVADELLEKQEEVMEKLSSNLKKLCEQQEKESNSISENLHVEMKEENSVAEEMNDVMENGDIGKRERLVLQECLDTVQQDIDRLSDVEDVRSQSGKNIGQIEDKIDSLEDEMTQQW